MKQQRQKPSLLQTSNIANKHNLWDAFGKSNLKYSRILDQQSSSKTPIQSHKQISLINKTLTPSNYLIRSLVSIFLKSQQNSFTIIKQHSFKKKIQSLRLPLFQKKFKNFALQKGFLALKNITIIKTQKNIQLKINQRRNPNILLRNLNNLVQNKLNQGFRSLKVQNHRINLMKMSVQHLSKLFNSQKYNKIQAAFNFIRAKAQHKKISLKLINQISRIQEKAIKRIKNKTLNFLIQSSLRSVCQDQKNQRQQKLKQLSDKKHQQHKTLLNLRENARTLQSNINNQAYQKNRIKKDNIRQIRSLKIKTQQQCKQLEKQLIQLRKQQATLNRQMIYKQQYLNRRINNKRASQNFFANVEKVVKMIKSFKENQFKNSDYACKILGVKKNLEDIDEFHIHQNLRMKEQIRMYEGLSTKIDSPQFNRAKIQNEKIRNMIELLVDKQMNKE